MAADNLFSVLCVFFFTVFLSTRGDNCFFFVFLTIPIIRLNSISTQKLRLKIISISNSQNHRTNGACVSFTRWTWLEFRNTKKRRHENKLPKKMLFASNLRNSCHDFSARTNYRWKRSMLEFPRTRGGVWNNKPNVMTAHFQDRYFKTKFKMNSPRA